MSFRACPRHDKRQVEARSEERRVGKECIDGITQKMLLEQLKELIDYGFVQKKSFEGYPLHVEYSLTSDMGEQILEALRIMQHIGIDYLKANGMEHILEEKGVVPD